MIPDPQTCLALARAVVDAGKWPFSVGMRVTECRALTRQGEEWRGIGTVVPRSDPGHGAQTVWCDSGYLSYLSRDALPDFTDPLTAAGAQTVAEIVHNDPTLHLVPVSIDRYEDAEPVTCWRIERMIDGETEWLRESGAWGAMEQGHRDPPICCSTKLEALIAAILAAPETQP